MIHGCFSRGTTPDQIFTLPFEKELISDLKVTYAQNKQKILQKTLKDVKIEGNDISFTLTQEETFKFSEKGVVSVQLKIKTINGQVLNSDIIHIRIDPALDEEVI